MREYLEMIIAALCGVFVTWSGKKLLTKREKKVESIELQNKEIDIDDKILESHEKKIMVLLNNFEQSEVNAKKMFDELINIRQERIEYTRELQINKAKVITLKDELSTERERRIHVKQCKDSLLDKYGCSKAETCEMRDFLLEEKRHM